MNKHILEVEMIIQGKGGIVYIYIYIISGRTTSTLANLIKHINIVFCKGTLQIGMPVYQNGLGFCIHQKQPQQSYTTVDHGRTLGSSPNCFVEAPGIPQFGLRFSHAFWGQSWTNSIFGRQRDLTRSPRWFQSYFFFSNFIGRKLGWGNPTWRANMVSNSVLFAPSYSLSPEKEVFGWIFSVVDLVSSWHIDLWVVLGGNQWV